MIVRISRRINKIAPCISARPFRQVSRFDFAEIAADISFVRYGTNVLDPHWWS
jgi:hypothetical protein